MIGCILLAAGRSQRMGSQKLLLPIAGVPMIARIADELCSGPVESVVVVVGADGERIRQVLNTRSVTIVENSAPESGMLSSVRCGLRALPDTYEGVLVVLGDQPGLTRKLVAELIATFRRTGRRIVVPTFAGRRGHPLLFGASLIPEVLNGFDDVGLRGLLLAHPEEITEVEVAAAHELADLDTPEDYERVQGEISRGVRPAPGRESGPI